MPEASEDVEIIHAAYAEKVKELFKVFAENIGMGENQASSRERFLRSLELVRKARDLAVDAASGIGNPESHTPEPTDDTVEPSTDGLSAADRALIEQALAGTTGARKRRF